MYTYIMYTYIDSLLSFSLIFIFQRFTLWRALRALHLAILRNIRRQLNYCESHTEKKNVAKIWKKQFETKRRCGSMKIITSLDILLRYFENWGESDRCFRISMAESNRRSPRLICLNWLIADSELRADVHVSLTNSFYLRFWSVFLPPTPTYPRSVGFWRPSLVSRKLVFPENCTRPIMKQTCYFDLTTILLISLAII